MHDATRVGSGHRVTQLLVDGADLAVRESAHRVDVVPQILTLEQLHHQVGQAARTVDASREHIHHVLAADA